MMTTEAPFEGLALRATERLIAILQKEAVIQKGSTMAKHPESHKPKPKPIKKPK